MPGELPLGEGWYRERGIDIVDVDRGGKLTYHGPGQLVGYPIMRIVDVIDFLRTIEQAIVATLADVAALDARARPDDGPDYTGVWTGARKIASIGVHVSRGVTTHGFAINVDNDLDPFSWVVPCGLDGVAMTSVAHEAGDARAPMPAVRASVAAAARRGLRARGDPRSRRRARRAPSPRPSPLSRRMSRIADAVRLRAITARHRGDAVFCPLCEHGFDAFKDDWNRANALCWRCGSHERHRAQWLLLERRPRAAARRALAAALLARVVPVAALAGESRACATSRPTSTPSRRRPAPRRHGARPSRRRIRRDPLLARPRARRGRRPAMRELRRVTAPGGFCLVMVPLDLDRERTYEDPSITEPADRERAFLQFDHVRLYAPDIAIRLRRAGFDVETIDMAAELGADADAPPAPRLGPHLPLPPR